MSDSFRPLFLIFIYSFGLNVAWEHLHSALYGFYKGGPITEFILMRASLADASILTILAVPFLYVDCFRARKWLILILGAIVAVVIELYALYTGRWEYNLYMPIVPFLSVGLTPAVQLGLSGYIIYSIVLADQVDS